MILSGFACKESLPQPYVRATFLSAEDIGVTDAWLKLRLLNPEVAQDVILKRDGLTVLSAHITQADTLLVSDSLLPKHSYAYKAYRLANNTPVDSSDVLPITTMDTTSHSFSFQIDTLGDGGSSVLNDVFILNDTVVYAVGEIYVRDSSGQFNTDPYNLLTWNGRNWGIKSITYVPLRAVFAFSDSDIWAGSSAPYHWDGHNWRVYNVTSIFNGYINKFFGTSSTNLYMVGTNGSIARFDGAGWQKLESGTTLPIQDIWGGIDLKTGQEQILSVASNTGQNQGKKFLLIQGTTVTALPDSGLNWSLGGVWFVPNRKYYIVGDGMFVGSTITSPTVPWKNFQPGLTDYYTTAIRGTGLNNIFVVGAFGNSLHFNGATWFNSQSQTLLSSGGYVNVDVKGKLMVAVGLVGNRAVALRGYQH